MDLDYSKLTTRVAKRSLEASAHRKSIALMKWLANTTRQLGISKEVYVVGGAVRDFVLDRPIKDIDLVVDSLALGKGRDAEWVAKKLVKYIPAKTNLTVNNYLVAIITISNSWVVEGEDLQGEMIEIATARSELYGGSAGKGYKPHEVTPVTIEEDLCRRELTYNCLLWRLHDIANGPDKKQILDLTGCGLKDLAEGIMRCPSDPKRLPSAIDLRG